MVFDQCQAMLNLAFTGPEKLQECPEALALPSTQLDLWRKPSPLR